MSLPLPLHYADLIYKDPDAAVCACMARAVQNHLETQQPSVGITGCGLNFYSPLGTEVWGRSLLVFHSFDVTSATSCDFRVLRLAQSVKTIADQTVSQASVSEDADGTNSNYLASANSFEGSGDNSFILNTDNEQHQLQDDTIEGNKKRKSSSSETT